MGSAHSDKFIVKIGGTSSIVKSATDLETENSVVEILFKKDVVDAYPDGWSCVNCGTEFSEKTINVECLYVVNTEAGTLCLKCHGDDKKGKICQT